MRARCRLRGLVAAGVPGRSASRTAGQRTCRQYRLTERGLDLFPVLTALMHWSDRHPADDAGVAWKVHHAGCGHPVETVVRCPAHERTLGPLHTSTGAGPGARPA